ncbi:MAG TPA: tetratricopeptide repeat protein, partial [Candidatus Limnocylindrales bacterium]
YREHRLRAPTRAGSHDPRASRIDEVLARRIGLPIMLSIVELEVAWRIGLPLHGVGLPGHFIVGGPGGILIDPAGGGRTLGPDDCETLLRDALGADVRLHPGLLRPVRRREIVARVLRNLRVAHLAARDWAAALGIVELLEVVEPTEPDHERDRGLLLGRMGRFTEAIGLLHRYLEVRPDASDAEDVRQVIGIFRGRRN